MSKKRLLVIGNSYMNFITKVKRAPERGETVLSNLDHLLVPGGLGAISAISAAKFGLDVVLCTRIGNDENGEKLKSHFINENLDMRFVITDRRKETGYKSITIEDGGKARTIVFPGANATLTFDDVESAFTCYPDAVLINYDLRDDLIFDTIKFAAASGIPVILSCGSEKTDVDVTGLDQVEIFAPNREQTFYLTGIDPVDVTSALRACVKMKNQMKTKLVVIKLGERGVFVFDGVYSEIIPARPVNVVDTTGAGTIFNAALAYSYLETGKITQAANFANAAASFSVSKDGVFNAIPTPSDVETLLGSGV
ncbi:MAG: hypothetical protein E7582_02985 [Ruminococcaceae bacterium]|nr:hypothetical protein [Oscillospiraceae bacterium]